MKTCNICGGLQATQNGEVFAAKPCVCDVFLSTDQIQREKAADLIEEAKFE